MIFGDFLVVPFLRALIHAASLSLQTGRCRFFFHMVYGYRFVLFFPPILACHYWCARNLIMVPHTNACCHDDFLWCCLFVCFAFVLTLLITVSNMFCSLQMLWEQRRGRRRPSHWLPREPAPMAKNRLRCPAPKAASSWHRNHSGW